MSSILSQTRDLRRALKQFNEIPQAWEARESKTARSDEVATWRQLREMIECQGFMLLRVTLPREGSEDESEDVWVLRYGPLKQPR